MRCNEVEELMAAYVAGLSGRQQAQAIATHLLSCAACRAWHDEVRATWCVWQDGPAGAGGATAIAAAVPAADDAPDLVTPVMQRLQRPRPALTRLPLRQALIHYGVAASVAMFLFTTGLMDRFGTGMLNLQANVEQLIDLLRAFLASI